MSLEAFTPPAAAMAPEIANTPPTPEEQFASHVAWVREQGDGLDERTALWPSRVGMIALASSAVAGTQFVEYATVGGTLVSYGVIVGIGTSTVALTRLHDKKIATPRAVKRLDQPTQAALGLDYELYKTQGSKVTKRGEIALLYRGQHDDTSGENEADALTRIAKLAKQNGITSMLIPSWLQRDATSEARTTEKSTRNEKPELMTLQDWLIQAKGIHTTGRSQRITLAAAHPDFWLGVAGHPRREAEGQGADALLERLATLNPLHPALRKANDYRENTAVRDAEVQKTLCKTLEQQMGDTEAVPFSGDRHAASRYPRREKVHTTAHISGEHVEFRVNGAMTHRQQLEEALGMHGGRLEQLLENEDSRLRAERQTALEYVLYRTLHRQEQEAHGAPSMQDAPAQPPREPYMTPVQRELITREVYPQTLLRINTEDQTGRRVATVALGGIIGLLGIGQASELVDNVYEAARAQATTVVAQERHMDPGNPATIPEDAIDRKLAEQSGFYPIWGSWYDYRKSKSSGSNNTDPGYDDPTGNANGEYGVGNFEDPNPHVVWNLESHNGMDASGYWIADTSDTLAEPYCAEPCDTFNFAWRVETDQKFLYQIAPMQTAPNEDWQDRPYVKVSRQASISSFISQNLVSTLPLPMRQGTKIFAANVNGKPAPLVMRKDGSIALRIDVNNKDDFALDKPLSIEYWVQPDTNSGPHDRDREASFSPQFDPVIMHDIFGKYVPGYTEAKGNPDKQREAVYNYLKHEFLYTYTPIDDAERKRMKGYLDFVNESLQRKLGVCNTESTILILADPRLAAGFGFYNGKGVGAEALTSLEAHMVTLDGRTIVDPVSERAFIGPAQKPGETAPLLPWVLLAGAIQLAGVAVMSRRSLMQAARNQQVRHAMHVADRADAKLRTIDARTLHMAANAAEAAAWRPGGATAEEAAMRADLPGNTHEKGLARVAALEFRDPGTAKRLKQQSWNTKDLRRVHKLAVQSANRPAYQRQRK